jgi:hypothetical protein
LKPEVDGSTKEMTYQIKDGIFKAICERAKEKRSMDSLNDAIEQDPLLMAMAVEDSTVKKLFAIAIN